jgi:alkylation response protein AidB-like acyl-CoA dehydrogenase
MDMRWSRPGTWLAVAYHRGVMTEVSGVSATIKELAARFLADAAAVDAADALPTEHVRGLADAGLYGVFAPVPEGGLGLTQPEVWPVVEELASALAGDAAGRLAREAAFLLVFGSRPAIREALLDRLTRRQEAGR